MQVDFDVTMKSSEVSSKKLAERPTYLTLAERLVRAILCSPQRSAL